MSTFQDLPDELVLKVLKNSETKDLISCSQVSQRIRRISHDGSLWLTANLEKKIVKTDLLEMILNKGCKILNISNSTIVGNLRPNVKSLLRVLNLSQSDQAFYGPYTENVKFVEQLLDSCRSLQQLEMEGLFITPSMAISVCKNGLTLKKLNLNYSFVDELSHPYFRVYGLDYSVPKNYMQEIIKWCQELKEVDLIGSDCGLNYINLDFLVKNITPNIEKINLKSSLFYYEVVKILFFRCKKMKSLIWAGHEIFVKKALNINTKNHN